jgi:hypothetical protein
VSLSSTLVLSLLTLRSSGLPSEFESQEPLSDSDDEYPDEGDEDSNGEQFVTLVFFHFPNQFQLKNTTKMIIPKMSIIAVGPSMRMLPK